MTPRNLDVDGLFERNADTRLLDRRRSEELGLPPLATSGGSSTELRFGPESMLSDGVPIAAPRGAMLRVALQARPERELIPGAVVTLVAEVNDDGDTDADDVRLRIAIPPETEALEGSFVRDDVELDGESLLGEGLRIGTVAAATAIRVRFALRVLPGTEPIDVLAYADAPGVPAIAAPALRLTRRTGHVAYDSPRPFFELEAGEEATELAAPEEAPLDEAGPGETAPDEVPPVRAERDPLATIDTIVDETIPFAPLVTDPPAVDVEPPPQQPKMQREPELPHEPEPTPEPLDADAHPAARPRIGPPPEVHPHELEAHFDDQPQANPEPSAIIEPQPEIAPQPEVAPQREPEPEPVPEPQAAEVELEPEPVAKVTETVQVADEPPAEADAAPVQHVLARALDADEIRALERVFAGAVPHGLAALALLSSVAAVDTPLGAALGVREFARSVAAALPRALVAARMNRPTPAVVTPGTLATIRPRAVAATEPLPYDGALLVTRLDERELDALRAVLGRELDDPFLRGVQVLLAVAPRALEGVENPDAADGVREALNAYRIAAGGWLMRVTVRRAVDRKYDPLTADDATLHGAGRALVAALREAVS